MRVHKVGILLSSPLLAAGLGELLHRTHGITAIDIAEGACADTYTQLIARECPSLMVVDAFTSGYCPADTRSVLLTAHHVPEALLEGHAAVLSVYDPTETIVGKIRQLLEPDTPADNRSNDLSRREKDVILGIVKGLSNKEIATEMNVSVNTVMTHRRNIAAKLEIHSPAGLTIFAIATGLVKLEDVAL